MATGYLRRLWPFDLPLFCLAHFFTSAIIHMKHLVAILALAIMLSACASESTAPPVVPDTFGFHSLNENRYVLEVTPDSVGRISGIPTGSVPYFKFRTGELDSITMSGYTWKNYNYKMAILPSGQFAVDGDNRFSLRFISTQGDSANTADYWRATVEHDDRVFYITARRVVL